MTVDQGVYINSTYLKSSTHSCAHTASTSSKQNWKKKSQHGVAALCTIIKLAAAYIIGATIILLTIISHEYMVLSYTHIHTRTHPPVQPIQGHAPSLSLLPLFPSSE